MQSKKIFSISITILLIMSLMIPIVKAEDATPQVSYSAYIEGQGWEKDFVHKNGEQAGTTGKAKAIEGIKINLTNLSGSAKITYRVHSRDIGWQNWVNQGNIAGQVGKGTPIEAIEIQLQNSKEYTIQYRAHVADIGWQDWVNNGDMAGTTGKSKSIEAIQIKIIKRDGTVVYSTYIQSLGQQVWKGNGETAGTTGQSKAIYSLKLDTVNLDGLLLDYQVHVQDAGWMDWVSNGTEAGSKEKNKKIEAIRIKVKNSNKYTVKYRVHVQDIGWQDWVADGTTAGTTGKSKRIEAIEIKIEKLPATIRYKAHVRDIGWQNWVKDSQTAGTTGQVKSIEALYIDISDYEGLQIQYQAHVQDIGWMNWVGNNQQAGTTGQVKPMEAIKIQLVNSSQYSIKYRVHVQDIGWMNWCYDGEVAGTTGRLKPIEAIQIQLIPKVNIVTETLNYGQTGLKHKGDSRGSDLYCYRFGQGPNVLFATFAVHGFEDKWAYDGTELTLIAIDFYNKLVSSNDQSLANKWTIYIFPEVNADGRRNGWTNNGPGRTTLYSKAPGNKGIDMNRCWEITGVPYKRYTDDRNYNGTAGFQAFEAEALKNFLINYQSKEGQTILIDLHGWTNQLIGDSGICNSYYSSRFPNADKSAIGSYGSGYLINWARSTLKSTKANAKSALIELPSSGINNANDVKTYNLSGRYIEATLDMLRNISVPVSSNSKAKARMAVASATPQVQEVKEISQEEQFNITLAGMIKNNKPEENEIETLLKQRPTENGVWVAEQSRESILNMINENANCEYEIDGYGYIKLKEENTKNKYDELLEKMMNSDKQYVLSKTGQYYARDYMTGAIENNPFEKMDKYQTYDYVETDNKMAIIFTSNETEALTNTEILDSLVEFLN